MSECGPSAHHVSVCHKELLNLTHCSPLGSRAQKATTPRAHPRNAEMLHGSQPPLCLQAVWTSHVFWLKK